MRGRRHLLLDGARNVRDVGGYRTTDGRRTRWRTLLRADSLHRLSAVAQAELVAYGVRTVVDLRRPEEAAAAPSVFARGRTVRYVPVPFGDAVLDGDAGPRAAPPSLVELYRLALERRQEPIRATLALLAGPGGLPAVVHCTAGKDRTGLVIALALAVAGVPARTIATEYALSASYGGGRRRDRAGGSPERPHPSSVSRSPAVMLRTLAWIEERYGGVGAYLRGVGLSPAEQAVLRAALTA
jgi:protein-tyrosine phosphatase